MYLRAFDVMEFRCFVFCTRSQRDYAHQDVLLTSVDNSYKGITKRTTAKSKNDNVHNDDTLDNVHIKGNLTFNVQQQVCK